jgi:hypothetical protein
MRSHDFSDAHVKLSRAIDHIAQVDSMIHSFLSTEFYRLRFEPSFREGRVEIVFDSLHQPDKYINAVIGDATSSLRSALDYIAVSLVKPFGGDPTSVGFPFGEDIKNFKDRVSSSKSLGVCSNEIQLLFIDEVQAYKDGKGHSLWILNKLRNIDKHRLLIASANLAGLTTSFRDRNGNVFSGITMLVEASQSGTLISAPLNHVELTQDPRPVFEVRLSEPPYIEGVAVTQFLQGAASIVKQLLDLLEKKLNI